MKVFTMTREKDESKVSGTGQVLEGVVFPSGKCVVCWNSEQPSVEIWDSYENFYKIHVGSHPTNGTVFHFVDLNQSISK